MPHKADFLYIKMDWCMWLWVSILQPSVFNLRLERLDCSQNPRSDIRLCSIPNGQKQHFSVLSHLHEKNTD